jgi:hypothetical protein
MKKYTTEDFLSPEKILNILVNAVRKNKPLSISRLSDAELGVIYQGNTESHEHLWWSAFCEISGVKLPCLEAKNQLIEALKQIDIMGIFVDENDYSDIYTETRSHLGRDTQRFFDEYQVYPERVFYCFDHYRIPAVKKFGELIKYSPPLLIGNTVQDFANLVKEKLGVEVAGIVPCKDIFDVDNVIEKSKQYQYTWTIVSAGTPAKIICSKLTKEHGKTTLDLGNACNRTIDNTYDYCYLAI